MSGYRAGFSKYHSVQWSIQEAIEAPRFTTHAYDPGLLKIEERLFKEVARGLEHGEA